jgi:CBS domain-containing protein
MLLEKIGTKNVVTVSATSTIEEASKIMRECHVGDLVVTQKTGNRIRPVGIITDRDIVVSVCAFGVAPWNANVGDIMIAPFVMASIADSMDHILNLMQEHGVKRIPLENAEGDLVGIVSSDDLTRYLASELNVIGKILPRQKEMEARRRPRFH